MLTITLPWPDARLHPNKRLHFHAVAKVKKTARHDAWVAGIAATTPANRDMYKRADTLNVEVLFLPPDNRRRDTDGMLTSCKAALDGIADALGVDDSRWRLTIDRGEPVKGGAVIVSVRAIYLQEDTEAPRINAERADACNADPLLTETALRRRAT